MMHIQISSFLPSLQLISDKMLFQVATAALLLATSALAFRVNVFYRHPLPNGKHAITYVTTSYSSGNTIVPYIVTNNTGYPLGKLPRSQDYECQWF
jgi:hypothetical protein